MSGHTWHIIAADATLLANTTLDMLYLKELHGEHRTGLCNRYPVLSSHVDIW